MPFTAFTVVDIPAGLDERETAAVDVVTTFPLASSMAATTEDMVAPAVVLAG